MRYTQKDIRQKLGISRDTLRLYEKKGIIEPDIDPGNGYRYYDDWQVNLLWDCRYYQGMGFSLAQVQDILKRDSLDRLAGRIETRERELARELELRGLALREHRHYLEGLRSLGDLLGSVRECDFAGCVCVIERELHQIADEVHECAIAFANRNVALMKPYFWFPEIDSDRYYWGSAMRLKTFEDLGEELGSEGVVRLDPCRALETVVDAGERGGFDSALFAGFLDEALERGFKPVGSLHGVLLARTHDENGFHRYIRAYLPIA